MAQLPLQKRGLSIEEAAGYVGLSVALFEKQVKAGILPARWPLEGTRMLFDRVALDKALDRLSGLKPAGPPDDSTPGAPKDWSALFEASLAPRKKRS